MSYRQRPVSMAGMDPGLPHGPSPWAEGPRDDEFGDISSHGFRTLRMTNEERSPTLYRIRAAGVLRVGTTGDYTPFSLLRADGSYEGADIDMAHDLAGTIGVGLEFVASVWVDLLDDFLGGRFDIAMGGVTVTPARAARAFFSIPTFVDGKRPL